MFSIQVCLVFLSILIALFSNIFCMIKYDYMMRQWFKRWLLQRINVYFPSPLELVSVTLFRKGSFGNVSSPGWPQNNKNVLETLLLSLHLPSTKTYFTRRIKEENKSTYLRTI